MGSRPRSAGAPRGTRLAGLLAVAVAIAAATTAAGITRAHASPGDHPVRGDLDGDGYADLAIGIPGANGGKGAVDILLGSPTGLSTSRSAQVTLTSLGIAGFHARAGDEFGYSVAIGDVNGDGLADLAVGIPGRSAVVVVFGSDGRLLGGGAQVALAAGPLGGWSLAVADFNRDGYDDLAVGSPFANVGRPAGGAVGIYAGSASGLTATTPTTAQRIAPNTQGLPGPRPVTDGNFGLSLAAGDFNGDGYPDLAIGQPDYGAYVLQGSPAGVTTAGSHFLRSFGNGGGAAVAAGDFNGDGYDDLAIGEPQTYTSAANAGMLEIHPGSSSGITDVRWGTAPVIAEVTPGMPGPPTRGSDFFAASLAEADVNGDGVADLIVGVPGKSAAVVLYGTSSGITTAGSQFLPGVGPQASGGFAATGVCGAAADFDADGFADVVLGEPFADTSQTEAGVVEIFAGSAAGAKHTRKGTAPVLSESTPGMPGAGAGTNDNFGFSLAPAGQAGPAAAP